MVDDIGNIYQRLKEVLSEQVPPLRIRSDSEKGFEVCGTKEALQGKQKVDGFYFASLVLKPEDVRFYFFPIYTHVNEYEDLSEGMRKALKGKSCFHVRKMDESLENDIRDAIQKGIKLYQKDNLI